MGLLIENRPRRYPICSAVLYRESHNPSVVPIPSTHVPFGSIWDDLAGRLVERWLRERRVRCRDDNSGKKEPTAADQQLLHWHQYRHLYHPEDWHGENDGGALWNVRLCADSRLPQDCRKNYFQPSRQIHKPSHERSLTFCHLVHGHNV